MNTREKDRGVTAPRTAPVKETALMIAGMQPRLQPDTFVFCTATDPDIVARALAHSLGHFREADGVSIMLPTEIARHMGFSTDQPMAQITLAVHSALDGVGLTAAVATALADANIPCNMVAAYHHDHVFVPASMAARAIGILLALANQA